MGEAIVEAINMQGQITADHQLHLAGPVSVPAHLPPGNAAVVLLISPDSQAVESRNALLRLAGVLRDSKAFFGDAVAVQRRLRAW